MVMKYFKGSLLMLVVVMMCSVFWGMGEVKAAEPDFFREYFSQESFEDDYFDFRLEYKCRLTIYIKCEKPEDTDYNDIMLVSIDEDSDYYDDTVFEKYMYSAGSYQKTITLEAGKYTLYVISDVPYYISLSGAYYPELSEDDITLEEGKSKKLKVNGTRSEVKWSSSKKSVATVNSQGVVKAKKPGEAVITAKCGEYALKCYVTVEKKPATYKAIAKKMKAFAKKNKYFKFKTINAGKKCRLYACDVGWLTDESVMYSDRYGMFSYIYPYIELVKKGNNKSEIRLRIYGELYELSLDGSTSLYCSDFNFFNANNRLRLNMKNTYARNTMNYSPRYYEGRMQGYATISTSSKLELSKLKKFKTMLGQRTFNVRLNSFGGAYMESNLSNAERKNWYKLVKEYYVLLKDY